ncbi:MAG: Stk1 family PASTA domain-containing Ser/Thr kinase [Corynebacterium sp.]|nr:Stk1 family PASTA domain-containing Ser/Thr kinase [Corynebacterium sp.]
MMLADRFELGEIIGRGGMADVYAGTDTLIGREVAIKIMRPELARDHNFYERFRKEGQNAGKLNHPAIVQIYDTGDTEMNGIKVPYIVMERVHGRTLREIIREDGVMTPQNAARILMPVCDALQASHDAGIIHRDIKPANIMITNTGDVKVMDFGIARALSDTTSAMTQTAAVIGTAQYLSPEQARGKKAAPSSDVYALGCVFYEMITAKAPFQGETPFEVAYQHVHEDPIRPSEYIGGLTPTSATNVDAVVLTALAKNPEDRYHSAAEFAADLDRLSRNAVTEAARMHLTDAPAGAHGAPGADASATEVTTHLEPVPATEVINAAPRSGRYSTATNAAAAAGAANAGAVPAGGYNRHNEPVNYEEHRRWPTWLGVLVGLVIVVVIGVFAYTRFTGSPIVSTNRTASNVTIPTVANLTEQDATNTLQTLGLKVNVTQQSSATVAKGNVISVSPDTGSSVPANSTVTLTVSTGREVTEVPDLSGKTTAEAQQILSDAGLSLDTSVRQDSSDTVEAGKIMEQSPTSGSQVSKGSKVTVTVSTGVSTVRVPVISGLQWSQAQGNLTSLGINPTVQYVDNTAASGTVISVTGEGTTVPKDAQIVVQVSRGNMISMPNITGMTTTQALSVLRSAGWQGTESNLVVTQVTTPSLLDQGHIQGQSPAQGENILVNGSVNVNVYTFGF